MAAAAQESGPAREEKPWYEALELGLTMDLISEWSSADQFDRFNQVRLRSLQFQAAGQLQDVGWAYAVMDFSDGGGGSDWVLREGAAWITDLTEGFQFRAGKYYADLGAWNRVYAHEFPAPNYDSVRRSFLGGNLALTGVEVHNAFETESSRARWSVGLAGDAEGQDVDLKGNGLDQDSGLTSSGRRGLQNWAAHGRFEYSGEWDERTIWTVGTSAFLAPDRVQFTRIDPDGIPGSLDDRTRRDELRQFLAGVDFQYRTQSAYGEAWEHFSLEFWYEDAEYLDRNRRVDSDRKLGSWLMYEYGFNESWSVGGLLSWNERPALAFDDAEAYRSLFATFRIAPDHFLRAFFSHSNPGLGMQKYYAGGLQWVWTLGAARRGRQSLWQE